jgi:hypothetical protein
MLTKLKWKLNLKNIENKQVYSSLKFYVKIFANVKYLFYFYLTKSKQNIMATKTWKIGERARGGVITVEATKNKVSVITKQWDFSTGSNKGSNQSQAQELYRKEVNPDSRDAYNDLKRHLWDETTSWHTDQILEWIETKVSFSNDW